MLKRLLVCGLFGAGSISFAQAQTFTLPELGLQSSGAQRALAVRNRGNGTMAPLGYIDTSAGDFVSTGRVPLRAAGDVADYPASTRFTDRQLGSLANKLPGAPSIQSVAASLKDIAEFYSYGGKATGCGLCTTNPLSSVTSVNGTNTAGYTLSQWQAFYSVCNDSKGRNPVTALTNEVDEIAIQCVINKKTQNGILWLPSGLIYQSKPIISGEFALVVRGVGGREGTTLLQTARGQDGWHHGTVDTGWVDGTNSPIYGSRFSMHGVTLACGGPGSQANPFVCGAAIKADFSPATAGFTLSDISIAARGDQTFNHWYDGVNCNNCSLTEITRATIGGINTGGGLGSLLDMGTALAFTGKGAVQFSIRDVTTNGWNKAVTMTVGNKTNSTVWGNQEGFLFDNWQANQVMDALTTINFAGDGHESPQFVITNGQFNICRRLFYFSQASEIFINNNLVYGCTSGAQTGGTADYTQYVGAVTGSGASGSTTVTLTASAPAGLTAGVPFFGPGVPANTKVATASGATVTMTKPLNYAVSGQQFAYGKGSPGFDSVEYMVFNGTSRTTLTNNSFGMSDRANINTLGHFINSKDVLIQDNKLQLVFTQSMIAGWFNDSGNQRITERDTFFIGVSNFFTPVAGGTNGAANDVRFESFYKQFNTAVRSDRKLQYENSQVVTLDANKNAQLYMPPTLTVVPTSIQITNGSMDVNAAFCGANPSNTSLSGVGVTCPSAAANSVIRINYSLVADR